MAVDEKLAQRVRKALADTPRVTEKKMFSGLSFIVNDKMCINVGEHRIMCRIDPALHAGLVKEEGCSTVLMRGREYIGWVYVSSESLNNRKDLDRWVKLALDFNDRAKATKKRK